MRIENGKGHEIRERAFRFAADVAELCDLIAPVGFAARHFARQLLSSSSSVGANLEEADGAHSKPDFIAKCTISLKEARESKYWLRLLGTRHLLPDARLIAECDEIIAVLTTIVKKSRGE